jgi:hypothetical protein
MIAQVPLVLPKNPVVDGEFRQPSYEFTCNVGIDLLF